MPKSDGSTCYKHFKLLDQIEVYRNNYKRKGFLKTK